MILCFTALVRGQLTLRWRWREQLIPDVEIQLDQNVMTNFQVTII